MPVDHIRYDLMVRDALRGVVRRVIADAARNGMPGEHHFFIAFYTNAPGVKISPRLHAKYPEEMTVVLQHQFWDLSVTDAGFEVGLSFDGIAEKLVVPFDAMKGFFDPSVQFGLEFEVAPAEGDNDSEAAADGAPAPALAPTPIAKAPALEKAAKPARVDIPAADKPSDGAAPAKAPAQTGEVVSLDRFRKK